METGVIVKIRWNAVVLLRELRDRGYAGGYSSVKEYLRLCCKDYEGQVIGQALPRIEGTLADEAEEAVDVEVVAHDVTHG